jgi:hypothetical protein
MQQRMNAAAVLCPFRAVDSGLIPLQPILVNDSYHIANVEPDEFIKPQFEAGH